MKVCFITFGCRLNRAEALEEEAKYLDAGWELTESHSEADRFVVRGCSVTARAQRDCEKLICHLREKYPNRSIDIQGCLKRAVVTKSARPTRPTTGKTSVPTRTARAYLKVQDGCSGKCTFCIVPTFRGQSVSIDYDDVLDKAKRFIESGYHEIVVTGCNLSLYASQGKRLPDLATALAELGAGSDCRIRLGSVEPGSCALETIDAIAEHDNICRFLHLPIQSGSNRILLSMRRPYLVKDITKVLETAIHRMPDIGLGCDLMTGFPDESEMDFLATKSLLEKSPLSNAHIFPYSERPGTLAAKFAGVIPKTERSHRAHVLAAIIDRKRDLFARRFLGKTVEVIIEDEKNQSGWTSEYVWFKRSSMALIANPAPRKSLTRFTVTNYRNHHLVG